MKAFICGLSGPRLTEDEAAFLSDAAPWGVILFARNIRGPNQVKALCAGVRRALGREAAPILIDQEGGRVQRIGPPHLRAHPPARTYGQVYAANPVLGVEAARLGAKLIGLDLAALGVNVDCMPVLDIPVEGADEVIGDRAYGTDPDTVTTLGGAVADGLLSAGVLPVMKHVPGHGRAAVDSHKSLPLVEASRPELERQDFVPFRIWAKKMPLAMTAHVVYAAIDPINPATLSRRVIAEIVRGRIGFDGALMTDDISMGALSGQVAGRARRAVAAGCDLVLHCNGEMEEMKAVAAAVPELAGDALRRTEAALAQLVKPPGVDRAVVEARLAAILGRAEAA
ncbi:beta-N-acetylhexosaminidase [Propylenella binzhouense]|uniref:beta-N-acetylhexosaminidase n=1 Tax=Propylenella binzhouense TaxID=2555902 RepID=A0A964WT16_9HYPH|nr:beta-N-acetylhexosaminidase [Propylenella binzhouense]MYZ47375.1 beta-N-acetylhexosaminidase [Propylenella binzhouense]